MSQLVKDLVQNIIKEINNNDSWKLNLLTNWNSIIGNLHTKLKLEKIHEDTLIVSVNDSCWMQELYLMSNIIINNINKALGQHRINKLRFKLTQEKIKKIYIPQKKELEEKINFNSKEMIALTKIEDPHLSQVLEKYLIRCYRQRL